MKITKAVIPVAGYGTRFLPITKTINKSMLPILNRPVVDYIVADCVSAGITDIFFVVLPNETQLQDYYSQNQELQKYLIDRGAAEKVSLIENIHKQARFHFIVQPQDGRYGTAIPPLLMKGRVGDSEPFLILMGDDFIFRKDGGSEIADMIHSYQKSGARGLMMATKIPAKKAGRYGVIKTSGKVDDYPLFKSIYEKPGHIKDGEVLINISKYIFDSSFFEHLEKVTPDDKSGEFYINDAIISFAKTGADVAVHTAGGEYLDAGTVEGLIHANLVVARAQGIIK
jgi:UTP--glucose-1-phosphate uridylyltransferase